jgi:hypothetical protein
VPPRHGLHLFDPPIQRISGHCFEQFGGAVHRLNSIARNIKRQASALVLLTATGTMPD